MFIRECFQKQPVSVSFNAWIIMLLKTKNYLFEKHLYLILENLRIENYGVIRQLQNNSVIFIEFLHLPVGRSHSAETSSSREKTQG